MEDIYKNDAFQLAPVHFGLMSPVEIPAIFHRQSQHSPKGWQIDYPQAVTKMWKGLAAIREYLGTWTSTNLLS